MELNKTNDDMFGDEDMVVHPASGSFQLANLPVFNVGEVETETPKVLPEDDKGAPPFAGLHLPSISSGHLTRVDSRHPGRDPVFNQHLSEMGQFFTYPLRWGASNYTLSLVIQVPILGDIPLFGDLFEFEVKSATFDSPTGPVQNSSNTDNDRARGVITGGKMWGQAYQLDGLNPHSDARIASSVSKEVSADGRSYKLSWPHIPAATAYLVKIKYSADREFLTLPGWNMGGEQESNCIGKGWATSIDLPKFLVEGKEIEVFALFASGVRRIGDVVQ